LVGDLQGQNYSGKDNEFNGHIPGQTEINPKFVRFMEKDARRMAVSVGKDSQTAERELVDSSSRGAKPSMQAYVSSSILKEDTQNVHRAKLSEIKVDGQSAGVINYSHMRPTRTGMTQDGRVLDNDEFHANKGRSYQSQQGKSRTPNANENMTMINDTIADGRGMGDNKGLIRHGAPLGTKSRIRRYTTNTPDNGSMNDTGVGGSRSSGRRSKTQIN
jgi:hypothetical protein